MGLTQAELVAHLSNRNSPLVSEPSRPSINNSAAANDEEQKIQEARKAITVSKAAIEMHKREIDKIKATISVYNELVSCSLFAPLIGTSDLPCVVCVNFDGVLCFGKLSGCPA